MKNARSLDVIAADIHKLERGNVFDIGNLLIEAKAQCKHGEWGAWIGSNFGYAPTTAQRYMQAAKLMAKYCTVQHLNIGLLTLCQLANEADEDMPGILKELAKRSIKNRADAERLIDIGRVRRHYPDPKLPDETLWQLARAHSSKGELDMELVAALLKHKPETTAAYNKLWLKLIEEAAQQDGDEARAKARAKEKAKEKDAAKKEAEALLDGPPPVLPPPAPPSAPQKIGAKGGAQSAEAETFQAAMEELHGLSTKPLGKFVDVCTPKRVQEVIDFLSAILAKMKIPAA
jgi:hypothetical protein